MSTALSLYVPRAEDTAFSSALSQKEASECRPPTSQVLNRYRIASHTAKGYMNTETLRHITPSVLHPASDALDHLQKLGWGNSRGKVYDVAADRRSCEGIEFVEKQRRSLCIRQHAIEQLEQPRTSWRIINKYYRDMKTSALPFHWHTTQIAQHLVIPCCTYINGHYKFKIRFHKWTVRILDIEFTN